MFSGHLRYVMRCTRTFRVYCDLGAFVSHVCSLCQSSSLRVHNPLSADGRDGDTNDRKGHHFHTALHPISEANGQVSRCAKNGKGAEVQDMSAAAQRAQGRERARPRAFYVDCILRRRNWGPYLVILPCISSDIVGAGDADVTDVHRAEHFDSDMNDGDCVAG